MKKLLILSSIVMAASAFAQEPLHVSQSFLNPQFRSITYSNTFSITNLSFVDGTLTTNNTGLSWTNTYGSKFTVTASAYTNVNPVTTVSLYALRDGTGPWNANTNTAERVPVSFANISVTLAGGTGANAANSFVFSPVYDGTYASTATGDDFVFAVTPNGATTVTVSTNVPLWRWPGAEGLTVKSITAGDTDASSQIILKALKFNAWQPK